MTALRLLFVKESQNWPRASGHDVHGFGMMAALARRGHVVSLATIVRPTPQALAGLPLAGLHDLGGLWEGEAPAEPLSRTRGSAGASPSQNPLGGAKLTQWQRKFADYYGVKDKWSGALAAVLREYHFDAVIVVAPHLLPLLSVVRDSVRVWYPADDPTWHHLSRVKPRDPQTWRELRPAAVTALYERSFRPCFDRIWVVSPADRTAVRLITGCRQVDLIPNGVDADHYSPGGEPDLPTSCVFWGRLDFGPNVDALEWFLTKVWPAVKAATPSATFSVFGFSPREPVRELANSPGVELHPDLPDLRAEVRQRQVVVLPFVSGGGIKNKLLEAAALGMSIVCTRRALSGTKGKPAVRVAGRPAEWARALAELWADGAVRRDLGAAARRWVLAQHTWDAAARTAEAGIFRACRRDADGPGTTR
ncbi:MAG TPA: glycosyltransferase family 4 protein [Gemmataceae bacterium]|nr:glycosyltransferase family 4 protein [Gemmataceae bacterium]